MLKMMNRGYTVSEYLEFIDRARAILDEPAKGRPLMISGDFIVGFPTETEEDFEATVALTRRARYKNAFIFKYSPRPGTVAFDKLADDVSEADKRRRNNTLLAVQGEISDAISREQVGRECDVFVEGPSKLERKRREKTAAPAGVVTLTIGGRGGDEDEDRGCSAGGSHVHREETASGSGPLQLAGRTDGDQIVFFDAPAGSDAAAWTGRIVRVRINAADRLNLRGELIPGDRA